MKKSIFLCLAGAALLPSCAYMQTNKNIKELGAVYEGTELRADNISLHRKGQQWYIGSPAAQFTKHFPTIHDEVFYKEDNSPTYTATGQVSGTVYHPISTGTAICLQRKGGYAQTSALVTEIASLNGTPLAELKGGSTHAIRAEVVNSDNPATIISRRTPESPGIPATILAGLDKYTVDVVGTLAYNVAIPFMAPFVFFHEFLTED